MSTALEDGEAVFLLSPPVHTLYIPKGVRTGADTSGARAEESCFP